MGQGVHRGGGVHEEHRTGSEVSPRVPTGDDWESVGSRGSSVAGRHIGELGNTDLILAGESIIGHHDGGAGSDVIAKEDDSKPIESRGFSEVGRELSGARADIDVVRIGRQGEGKYSRGVCSRIEDGLLAIGLVGVDRGTHGSEEYGVVGIGSVPMIIVGDDVGE